MRAAAFILTCLLFLSCEKYKYEEKLDIDRPVIYPIKSCIKIEGDWYEITRYPEYYTIDRVDINQGKWEVVDE